MVKFRHYKPLLLRGKGLNILTFCSLEGPGALSTK